MNSDSPHAPSSASVPSDDMGDCGHGKPYNADCGSCDLGVPGPRRAPSPARTAPSDEQLCKNCGKPRREHAIGYSAYSCEFWPAPSEPSSASSEQTDGPDGAASRSGIASGEPPVSLHSSATDVPAVEGLRIGDYSVITTLRGECKLVDATDEDSPVASFVSPLEAERFWQYVARLASALSEVQAERDRYHALAVEYHDKTVLAAEFVDRQRAELDSLRSERAVDRQDAERWRAVAPVLHPGSWTAHSDYYMISFEFRDEQIRTANEYADRLIARAANPETSNG